MARPKTQNDLRFERIERAISTLAWMMANSPTRFGIHTGIKEEDARIIDDILKGTDGTTTTSEGSSQETQQR